MTFFTSFSSLALLIVVIAIATYLFSRRKVTQAAAADHVKPHSLARYYGLYAGAWALLPAFLVLVVWTLGSQPFMMPMYKPCLCRLTQIWKKAF